MLSGLRSRHWAVLDGDADAGHDFAPDSWFHFAWRPLNRLKMIKPKTLTMHGKFSNCIFSGVRRRILLILGEFQMGTRPLHVQYFLHMRIRPEYPETA